MLSSLQESILSSNLLTIVHVCSGTGKTSLIAAIANHMQYSIYDLDLTGVRSNLDLRTLLTQISDRAVVVLEDIDTVELPARLSQQASAGWGPGGNCRQSGLSECAATSGSRQKVMFVKNSCNKFPKSLSEHAFCQQGLDLLATPCWQMFDT